MQAFRLTSPQTAQLCTVAQPEPGPGEVLVKVGAAGICHSDLHIIDAPDALGLPTPFTLGHENAGWIEALGTGVSGLERGQPVAVAGFMGCGRCAACLSGLENACRVVPIGGIGLGLDGGMAEYLIAQSRQLLPIHDLELSQAAPLTDAGLTPYHAIAQVRQALAPGSTCVVIGLGGLGHMAVQILAATTATRIVAVDLKADALRLAHEHGAHVTVPSNTETAKHIRDLVGPMPGGADVVLDFVGAPATVDLARAVVSTGGHISVVGLGGGALPVGYGTIPFEVTVRLPFWGTRGELAEVLALARAGRIRAQVQEFGLDHVVTAYDALRAGRVAGRAVVVSAR
jgi:alcohol dehydrogenase, propanol-preferring